MTDISHRIKTWLNTEPSKVELSTASLKNDKKFNSFTIANLPVDAYPPILMHLYEQACSQGRPLVCTVPQSACSTLLHNLPFFLPRPSPLLWLPPWDHLPYTSSLPNPFVCATRLSTLQTLLAWSPTQKPFFLLTSLDSLVTRIPSKDVIRSSLKTMKKGDTIERDNLIAWLSRAGYERVSVVHEIGEFCVRGGIIDVFSPTHPYPIRLDFFSQILEEIRFFSLDTQRSIEHTSYATLASVQETEKRSLHVRDILPSNTLFVFEKDARLALEKEEEHIRALHNAREKHLATDTSFARELFDEPQNDPAPGGTLQEREGELATVFDKTKAVPPLEEDFDFHTTRALFESEKLILLTPFHAEDLRKDAQADFQESAQSVECDITTIHPAPSLTQGGEKSPLTQLLTCADHEAQEGRHVILSYVGTRGRDRLRSMLEHKDIRPVDLEHASLLPHQTTHASTKETIFLAPLIVETGFRLDNTSFLSTHDVLGKKKSFTSTSLGIRTQKLEPLKEFSPGDLVVHKIHGIGRFESVVDISIHNTSHACLLLTYANKAKLYLPVENLDLLSRYGSQESGVELDKLGTTSFQARRGKLKKRIQDIAKDLIALAAQRRLKRAPLLESAPGAMDEFCTLFPFEETPDQRRAIEDVLEDLRRGWPMDRLVCGDVGFGKTEVALRAVFSAAMSDVQVAFIAPTTLLAHQHTRLLRERFQNFPVTIEHFSRLTSASDKKRIKENLTQGTCDIVIGTHALLGKNMTFKNLGLLVIDEEQHFGVIQKEKIKKLQHNVHILTLSATPIPRTLNMTFAGIKDLSVIATPPATRKSVKTFILPFDEAVILEALASEKERGGQSFYVAPRIQDLDRLARFLKEALPSLSLVTIHGQMNPKDIEEKMLLFYAGDADILLSTNIVESGLDVPRANTMIIHNAHLFGLAELYQLRGRVGRAQEQAYAYVTTSPHMTKKALARLKILHRLESLGSGFELASYDLDMRGAGNLLGQEQSGHIREVGQELYRSMLEEALQNFSQKARTEDKKSAHEEEKTWTPQISLDLPVFIPESYIEEDALRLSVYRDMAQLQTLEKTDAFQDALKDRFGNPCQEILILLDIMRVKILCKQACVEKLEAGPKGFSLHLKKNSALAPQKLASFLQNCKVPVRFRAEGRLFFSTEAEPLDQLKIILTQLKSFCAFFGI